MTITSILPMSVEKSIEKFINQNVEYQKLREKFFPNALLREDVLGLLDRFCTVVYFPIENEDNNGFHITDVPFAGGTPHNFVYINTAQTMEKQVFTAAHELGHIWNVDQFVLKDLGLENTTERCEMIINRFAAVLLIPEGIFRNSVDSVLDDYLNPDGRITVINLLKLVVVLMNQFFVPMKAIVLRLAELNYISLENANDLLGNSHLDKVKIEELVQSLIADFGYVKFQVPSMKKWIDGLSEKLDIAEAQHLVPQEKIEHIRKEFDLARPPVLATEMTDTLQFTSQEGAKENDN